MTSQSSVWRIGAFILALGAALACAPLNALFGGQQRDSGVGLESLNRYTATFTVTFVPDNQTLTGWTYTHEMLSNGGALRRTLIIEGVSAEFDPGDVTLVTERNTQYMTGEAVGGAGCLIFPASVDLETTFLLPGDFVPATALNRFRQSEGQAEVAGRGGTRYTFEADEVEGFTDVSGEMVADGGLVLSYDFNGHTLETPFTEDEPGTLSWQYAITDFAPETEISGEADCEIQYPVMDDAEELTRLPGLIRYTTPTPAADVVTYYQQTLEGDGWLVLALPDVSEDTTVLSYTRGGEVLNVSVKRLERGTEVQLFVEDRPAQP